jgi:IrrE N-terminal-like domain
LVTVNGTKGTCVPFPSFITTVQTISVFLWSSVKFGTYVAKKSLWLRLGYVIEDGQKSLYVWAPKSKRSGGDAPQATELEEELESSAAEEKRAVPRKREFPYVLVPVFGDCQLAKIDKKTGKPFPPLPSFQPSFSRDRSECYACLYRAAEVLGCSVREVQMSDAYGKNHKKEIFIDPRPDSTNKTITLAHELAHSLLHWGPDRESLTKKAKERHAQATAEVVCRYLGIQEETWTRDYLLAFQVTPRELEQDLEIISDAATTIIHALQTAVGFSSPLEVLEENAEQSSGVFAQV